MPNTTRQRVWEPIAAWLQARRGAATLALVGAFGFSLVLWLFAPGLMSHDSGLQLEQARNLRFHDAHPVLMALIWHALDAWVPGPLGLVALINAMYWAGSSVLWWALPRALWIRASGLLALGLFPPVACNLPVAWKDTLMQGALIAAMACFALSARGWRGETPPARRSPSWVWGWASGGVALCAVGIGARHNAFAAVWPLLAWPLAALPWLGRRRPLLRLTLALGGGLAGALLLHAGLKLALAPITQKDEFWQNIATFDLAAMSLERGELLVEPDSEVLAPGMGLPEMRQLFKPYYSLSLYYCLRSGGSRCVPLFRRTLDEQKLKALAGNWRRAVLAHPGAYLRHRLRLGTALVGLRGAPTESYFLAGIPHHRLARDYPLRERSMAALRWIDAHLRDTWMRPWKYAALCLVLWPFAFRRYLQGRGAVLPVLLPLSGLSYLASFVLGAGSPDYRYTVWTTLCGLLTLITSWSSPENDRAREPEPTTRSASASA